MAGLIGRAVSLLEQRPRASTSAQCDAHVGVAPGAYGDDEEDEDVFQTATMFGNISFVGVDFSADLIPFPEPKTDLHITRPYCPPFAPPCKTNLFFGW